MSRLQTWLRGIGASEAAVEWAGDRTLQQAWDECERGDLMLWLLRRMYGKPGWPTLKTLAGLCCDCAELVKDCWRGDEIAKYVATARAWCRGETVDAICYRGNSTYAEAIDANISAVFHVYAFAINIHNYYFCDYTTYKVTLRKCANIIRAAVPTLPEIPQEGAEA